MNVYERFACIYVCVPQIYLIFSEGRKGHWIPWNRNYILQWATICMLGIKPRTYWKSNRYSKVLSHFSSLPPDLFFFKWRVSCRILLRNLYKILVTAGVSVRNTFLICHFTMNHVEWLKCLCYHGPMWVEAACSFCDCSDLK